MLRICHSISIYLSLSISLSLANSFNVLRPVSPSLLHTYLYINKSFQFCTKLLISRNIKIRAVSFYCQIQCFESNLSAKPLVNQCKHLNLKRFIYNFFSLYIYYAYLLQFSYEITTVQRHQRPTCITISDSFYQHLNSIFSRSISVKVFLIMWFPFHVVSKRKSSAKAAN